MEPLVERGRTFLRQLAWPGAMDATVFPGFIFGQDLSRRSKSARSSCRVGDRRVASGTPAALGDSRAVAVPANRPSNASDRLPAKNIATEDGVQQHFLCWARG